VTAAAPCPMRAYRPSAMRDSFLHLATRVTNVAGSPYALLLAAVVIVTWLISGPMFGFSDTWQLAINTATTIVTFLMVFVIQATTNREMKATQIKLDELIRAVHGARNAIIATDLISEEEVDQLQREMEDVGKRAQARSKNGSRSGARAGARRRTRDASSTSR
jgi:low affinity Fe/Cu permease